MSILDTLKRWHEEAEASIAGEDAAHEWFKQGATEPPGDSTIYSMASEVAPGYEEQFINGFDERWDEGVEAQDMNVWERFWHSKAPL